MKHIFLVFFILLSCIVFGQDDYTISDKKAIKYYEVAINNFNANDYDGAIKDLNRAIEQYPEFVEAHLLKFEVYMNKRESQNAEESIIKALSINPDFFPNAHYFYGQLKFNKGEYETAEVAFDKFLTYRQTNPNLQEAAVHDLVNCKFAKEAIKNPVPFDPKNMGPQVNSSAPEYFPSLTTDDKTLLFTRRLMDTEKRMEQEDFYMSSKELEKWTEAKGLIEINTPRNEGAPSIAPDGQLLIFTACADNTGSYGEIRRGLGSCDLFFSFKEGDYWGKPRNMGKAINSSHWETQPSFSSDGKTLYFIRGLKKGRQVKNQDIYQSSLDASGAWTPAVKLGEMINTPMDESSVLIHPDGQTLYFTSNGHPGMGGEDIYISRKEKNGEWGRPVNLGYPINTHENENSITVTASGNMALFASDREGGFGGLDLYEFELPIDMRPARVNYLEGIVKDKESGNPLEGKFDLVDLETGEIVIESYSNAVDGKFLVSLPEGKDYALSVKRKGYLFFSENFAMKGGTKSEPFVKEILLSPIKAGESVVLRNVFFDTDSYVLKEESKSELGELVAFLNKNYKMKIEVSGHTDNKGSGELNRKLSTNRAKAVKTFLEGKGIPSERITAKGYGADSPVATNDTEEGRAQNRRTEFRVVSLD